jgi:hypothetical protein
MRTEVWPSRPDLNNQAFRLKSHSADVHPALPALHCLHCNLIAGEKSAIVYLSACWKSLAVTPLSCCIINDY